MGGGRSYSKLAGKQIAGVIFMDSAWRLHPRTVDVVDVLYSYGQKIGVD